MKILALDLSLNETGWYRSDNKETGIIKQIRINDEARISDIKRRIVNIMIDMISLEESIIIFLEGYSYGSKNTRYTFSAGELCGVIKNKLYETSYTYRIVAPTMWKKFICGKGNLKKEQILLQVYKKYKIEFKNNNECDAFCIGKFGEAYLEYKNGKTDFTKSELECLKKFDKDIKTVI